MPTPPRLQPTAARTARLRARLLAWYDSTARALAFRGTRDPYAVLVSEVILQQTQVSRGEPAWQAFMARFPTFKALAQASPADVLRAWAGLGYNRRALALRGTARAVVELHDGRLPDDLHALRALPGIGPYTARAIAAIAFGHPVGAVDTNVRRVLGRVLAGHGSARDDGDAIPTRELQAIADALVPADRPADWTAALMDLGASLCRPARPDCAACPLSADCRFAARATGRARRRGVATVAPGEPSPAGRRTAEERSAYEASSRWLRGRIIGRLRSLPDGRWTSLEPPIGGHGRAEVDRAVASLRRDGLLEVDGAGRVRLPL